MNDFEKYIAEHSSSLNKEAEASSDLWSQIDAGVQGKRRKRIRYSMSIAASLAVLLASTFLLWNETPPQQENTQLPLYAHSSTYGDTEKEFIEAIAYQKQVVNVTTISVEYSELFNPFIQELELLDATYDSYVEIINQNGCNDFMMELVVSYYQQKLDILNTLHQELIKIKDYETDTNSDQTSLNV